MNRKGTDMTDDQLLTIDGRPSVRLQRRLAHPVDKVWRALTESDHLSAWFPCPVRIDARPGGCMVFDMGDAAVPADASRGQVLQLDPPRLLEFSWADDWLRFELSPDGTGTLLVLTHAFEDRAGAASFATGWDICLRALAHVLAGESIPPPVAGVERHEGLVHRFGLDAPIVTETDGGWTVRFERQLTCPAEVAWSLCQGLAIGRITETDGSAALAFEPPADTPGAHVRVELVSGTGHGARMLLTVSGVSADLRDTAIQRWGSDGVERVAAHAAAWALGQSAA
jgi:uncharacterized protein YndB with AHSA1/START domain